MLNREIQIDEILAELVLYKWALRYACFEAMARSAEPDGTWQRNLIKESIQRDGIINATDGFVVGMLETARLNIHNE